MTAVNIIAAQRIITIATDGAVYDPSGFITAIGSKICAIPHLNCVFASRGIADTLPIIAKSVTERYATFDDVIANFDENFQDVARDYHGIEVYVAGLSANGPIVRFIQNEGCPRGPGYPKPYTSTGMAGTIICPALPDDIAASVRVREIDNQDRIVQQLRRTVAAQRRHVNDYGWHSVGAFCQITTVTTKAIETRITDRWPEDRIGTFIRPEKDLA